METFQYSNLPPAESQTINRIYNRIPVGIRQVSGHWILLFMVNGNLQVGYLARGNGNANDAQLEQFHRDFMAYLQSAQTHFQTDLQMAELPSAVSVLQNLSSLELYETLVRNLDAETKILRTFWLQNLNPYLNDSSEASIQQVLETLMEKAVECEEATQSVLDLSRRSGNQNGNQISSVPYLKVKVLYLVTFISRQLRRQSNILLLNSNLMRMLKWSEEDAKNWSEFRLERVKTWFSSLLEPLDKITSSWTENQFQNVRNSHPNPNPNSHSVVWDTATALVHDSRQLYRKVLLNSLAVETQPPSVIKQGAPVPISLLWFIPQTLFVQGVTEVVLKYKVLDRNTAQRLSASNINIGQITNFETVPNSQFSTTKYSNYVNLKFKQCIRREKPVNNGANILRQYHCLLFCVHFQHKRHRIRAWCCSGPFVYITGNGQRAEADGAMVWYNSFRGGGNRNENWMPLKVDSQVGTNRMGSALSRYFNYRMGTNRPFTRENCAYLVAKLLKAGKKENSGQKQTNAQALSNQVSIAMFLDKTERRKIQRKDKPTIERYSFWDWFSQTLDFAQKHLALFWEKGFLVEFIDRVSAEDFILKNQPAGKFFLRFNDVLPAGVSICYLDSRGKANSIQPFTDQHLQQTNLIERILDLGFDFKSCLFHHVEQDENGQRTLRILPWGDRQLSEPEFFLPLRPATVPDPLSGRSYIAHHVITSILQNQPPGSSRLLEAPVPAPAQVPLQVANEVEMDGEEPGLILSRIPLDELVIDFTDDEWQRNLFSL